MTNEMSSRDRDVVRSLPGNTKCVDCASDNPDWASVTFGVLLCLDCSGRHRGYGVHISFVRSLRMDSWSDVQVRAMKVGGNDRWRMYVQTRGLSSSGMTTTKTTTTTKNVDESKAKGGGDGDGDKPGPGSGGGDGDGDGDGPILIPREAYDSEAGREYASDLKRRAAASEVTSAGAEANGQGGGCAGSDPDRTAQTEADGSSAAAEPATVAIRPDELFAQVDKPLARLDAFLGVIHIVHSFVVGDLARVPSPRRVASYRLCLSAAAYLAISRAATAYLSPSVSKPCGRIAGCVAAIGLALPVIKTVAISLFLSKGMSNGRHVAFKSARNRLMDRIREGRAERLDKYDLYLPPPPPPPPPPSSLSSSFKSSKRSVPGFIFVPGAMVEHTAYSFVASSMSDEGILVVVLNLEPYRMMPFTSDTTVALRIMYDVVSRLGGRFGDVTEWSVGGHSMGASTSYNFATHMKPGVSKLVMWGSASPMGRIGSLSGGGGKSPVDVLVMNATEDALVNSFKKKDPKSYENFLALLPPVAIDGGGGGGSDGGGDGDGDGGSRRKTSGTTTIVTIEGGNHSGFAHYGPQLTPFPDGIRKIDLEEQQRIIVKETADFLLGRKSGGVIGVDGGGGSRGGGGGGGGGGIGSDGDDIKSKKE